MKIIKILLIIIICSLLTGCYNYRELNDLAIVSAVAVDKINDQYKVSVQVINIQKTDSGASDSNIPKFTVYSKTGNTIQEAIRNIINESSKRIYANHVRLVVFGESLAKEGIYNILDIFIRDTESRKQFYLMISKDIDALSIISTITPNELLNATNIVDSLKSNKVNIGSSINLTYEDILDLYLNDRTEVIIPSVTIKNKNSENDELNNIKQSEVNNLIELSSMSYFKEDKLMGYLDENESIALSFILNNIKKTVLTIECGDKKYASLEISETKVKKKNNKNIININITGTAAINEINCNFDLEKSEELKKIDKLVNNKIENNINNLFKKMKEENIDIFKFKDLIYKNNYKYYKNNNIQLNNIKVNINSNIKIDSKGSTIKVIKYEKN